MVCRAMKSSLSMDHVRGLLAEGRAQEALELINHQCERSDMWQNARGVCLLRLGLYEQALKALLAVVFPGGAMYMPEGMSTLYLANLITALLLTHHSNEAMVLMEHMGSNGHPYVAQVRQAVERWKKSLTLFQRAGLAIGKCPEKPVQMDFLPGSVWENELSLGNAVSDRGIGRLSGSQIHTSLVTARRMGSLTERILLSTLMFKR